MTLHYNNNQHNWLQEDLLIVLLDNEQVQWRHQIFSSTITKYTPPCCGAMYVCVKQNSRFKYTNKQAY